jgi:hypothetical protein
MAQDNAWLQFTSAINPILNWVKRRKTSLETALKTLSIAGAAIAFISSQISQCTERDLKRKMEALTYLENYNSTKITPRAEIANSPLLKKYFHPATEIPADVAIAIIESNTDESKKLKTNLVTYLGNVEALALARNLNAVDKNIIDSQFKSIIISDFKIFKNVVLHLIKIGAASCPEWKKTLVDYGIAESSVLPDA